MTRLQLRPTQSSKSLKGNKLLRKMKKFWYEKGKADAMSEVMTKFAELHDEYYHQGDHLAANLTVDMVAYMQEDFEALDDKGI